MEDIADERAAGPGEGAAARYSGPPASRTDGDLNIFQGVAEVKAPDMQAAALKYAERGWPVLPLWWPQLDGSCACGKDQCKVGKHPLSKLVPHGVKNATTDPDEIRRWWIEYPNANIGIAMRDMLVVDTDKKDGIDGEESLRKLKQEHGDMPWTLTADTGSGGQHKYYSHAGGVSCAVKLRPNLDIIGNGGYVVAAPSLHKSGRRYQWVNPFAEIEPAPAWFVELLGGDADAAEPGGRREAAPAQVEKMEKKCEFLKHLRKHPTEIDGGLWTAAACNYAMLGTAGEAAFHELSKLDPARYDHRETQRRLNKAKGPARCDTIARNGWRCPKMDGDGKCTLPKGGHAPVVLAGGSKNPRGLEAPAGGIMTYNRQMREITAEAVAAIDRYNGSSPRIFVFAKKLARITGGEIQVMDDDQVRHELGRVADWYTASGDGPLAISPPVGIASDILAMRSEDNPLPMLAGISTVPLIRADGSICQTDGYDIVSRTYFLNLSALNLRPVADQPTAEDVAAARQLIVDELLVDFPFVGEADLAHAVALLLTPFARNLIDGPVPPVMVEKPTPRTGATLMVQLLAFPALGYFIEGEPWPTEEPEREKTLLSLLMQSPVYVAFDNVNIFMNSAAFSLATTAPAYKGRLLSHNKMASPEVRCAWVLMANNPKMSREIAMRMGRCRLDAKMPDPSVGRRFHHDDIRGWARQHRGDLVWAALTLVRAWCVAQPRPVGQRVIGMYENFCRVIGGILDNAGVPGLFANREEFLRRAAPDLDAMSIFVGRWWNRFKVNSVKAAELLAMIDEQDIPLRVNGETERARKQSLGRQLEDLEDSQFVLEVEEARKIEVKLVRDGDKRGSILWRLRLMSPAEPPGPRELAALVGTLGTVAFAEPTQDCGGDY